ANILGILGGIVVFGDPLGSDPLMVSGRIAAFALVVAAVALFPAPVRAHETIAEDAEPDGERADEPPPGADSPERVGAGAHEALSLGSYILLFRTVFSCHGVRIGWKESYDINMAGVVASKLLAAAGAGGVALTVWALRASGLDPRTIARRMLSFELLLYAVYAGALVVVGVGLRTGVLEGRAPWTVT